MAYFCLRLSRVSVAVISHFMPYFVITIFWEFRERLLPILAPTKGFCRCVAIGHARVRAKTSIIGRFLTMFSFGN